MSALKLNSSPSAQPQQSAAASKIALARAKSRAGGATPPPHNDQPQSSPARASSPSGAAAQVAPVTSSRHSLGGVTRIFNREEKGAPERSAAAPKGLPAPAGVQVAGRIVRVLFGNAQSGKAMLLVQGDGGPPFKLQGALTFEPEVGRRVSAVAVVEEHPKWGRQYNSELILEEIPVDRIGAVAYMSRVLEGVGKATAGKLYNAFGESIYEVLQNEPRRLLGIGGITEAGLKKIVDSWAEDSAVRNIWKFLGRHGVSGAVSARIYSRFGARSMQVAKETPYRLTEVEGVDFMAADRIASECGVQSDSAARIVGALEYALEYAAQQGHTSKSASELVAEIQKLTGLGGQEKSDLIESVINERVSQGRLVARKLDSRVCLALESHVAAESEIALSIKRLVDAGRVDEGLGKKARAKAEGLKDSDQADAVANVFESPVSVITGRPGCGKTTVIKVITEVAKVAGLKVVMGAPTGKAARRMTEATGEPAATVHSVLKPASRQDHAGPMDSFQHDSGNPLSGDIFVIDEASMMDTALTRAYLDAIPSGARVVFVGDSDQLPSVGAGNVLRDVIASEMVPVARLQTIHRTALNSDIVVNAHRVINGEVSAVDLKGKKDFKFYAATEDQAIQDATLKRYLDMVGKYGADGVQVLCARRGTGVGVDAMNELIRPIVNPASPDKPELEHRGQMFRLGDRVMRTSNNKTLEVSNGEVGVITSLDPDAKRIKVNFGDREVVHEGKELLALQHAYATTIHKSQGSEYAGVITLVPGSHKFMLNRNLIYTAMTRGKKESDIVGDPSVLRAAIAKLGAKRCTGLAEEIRTAFGEPAPIATLKSPAAKTPPPALPARQSSPQASLCDSQPAITQRASLFRRARP
jgi:exodeoxyribonuclease V alpha subunit